ncbi:phosphoglycerate dehydrogenase [Candidatus Sulfurimonas marisnigri]|uniref:D-3-phosphoglycerate dehydrogenase n=1 Tax=Candidatus Sulfurimonas marisnigri TaxID=2740405 RepID=A0A7S7M203_9BACT|nr:phosphoglycerate dehydrogenase [Candidatus Sulfurimonas marisnigri]QOY55599.1 phosphoglycerate dehydrogenase [Candidatus Sulfurimonas marisnigri]
MKKHTIVVCDHIHEAGLEMLRNDENINFIMAADEDKVKLLDIIANADVAITRSSTDVDDNFIKAAKNMKAIVRAGVGVDNVDIQGCSKEGIIVMNVPTANTIAAVELTMAHILSCMRMFPYSHDHLKNQRIWKREKWYGYEMKGKKLGVIGFGNIGSRVAKRAASFEMDIVAFDPYINPSKVTDLDMTYTKNFEDILECDIITIHTPKNQETIGIIGESEIAKMKDGVVLINCARGGLYNEEALYNGLKSGKIRFAGIDVFNKEPATDHPLLDLDNIVVSPHLGANTYESQYNIGTQAAENAIAAAKGISYAHAMNLPIDESRIPPFVKPFLEMGQKIGFLESQINKSQIIAIKVSGQGEIGKYVESLATFVAVGAMSQTSDDTINYVNADFVAKEKGIKVESEALVDSTVYKNLITIKLTTAEGGTTTISATIFDDNVFRIVAIDGFDIEVALKGDLVILKNTDVPGVIGSIGSILANHNVNIADFSLARNNKAQAIAVILVDSIVNEATLNELQQLEACLSVNYARI